MDPVNSVQEEYLEAALWPSSEGQEKSQERMKWMRLCRMMAGVSFISRTWFVGDESRLARE